MEDIRYPK